MAGATFGDVTAIQAHLAAGVEIGSVDQGSGGTPLHSAAVCGRETVAQLLIQEGADIEALTIRGDTRATSRDCEIADRGRNQRQRLGSALRNRNGFASISANCRR